jgi:predicted secreted Zn-dependent protease
MVTSTPRRGPAGPRRALLVVLVVLVVLLVPIALLMPGASPPRSTERPPGTLLSPSAMSTATSAGGAGTGGSLMTRQDELPLAADPSRSPDVQAPAAAPAAVQVTSAASFYDVEGSDVRTLLASLRQRGPADGHGTWAASTGWVFRWSYQPVVDAGCHVELASVALDLTYTYPHWAATPDATAALVTAWQRYLERVELHEHGHRDIAQGAADDLVRTLEALPAQTTCEDLAVNARAAVDELLIRHAQAQVTYDRETGHGATQGAVLAE